MKTYKPVIEYDGTRYSGWQSQSNTAKTVQGKLQLAAKELFERVELGGAGRTDAGVHATAQVAHLRIPRPVSPSDLAWKLNEQLPPDIHVRSAEPAPDSFHARHDAVSRTYIYQISRRRTAFAKNYVWWVKDALNVEAMKQAAGALEGLHDFARLADRRAEEKSTRVKVEQAEVGTDGELILIRMAASHFLWKMVRKTVAVLVEIGRGAMREEQLVAMLSGKGPRYEPTAPPSGLFLQSVLYPGETLDLPLKAVFPVPSTQSQEPNWKRAKRT